MLKQKIAPNYFKYDLINSEMPLVFLDPTAKVQIYLYETNQLFDEIFLDESDPSVRLVEFKLHSILDAWQAQNFTKQINPFQNASAAKTIAMQTEIEMYLTKEINSLIEKKFYFFTFEQLNSENINLVNKFLIKESVDNLDRKKFRFTKIKAWILSSVLIKNFQYWKFMFSNSDLSRKKISKIKVKIPADSGHGNIRIEGNNILGQAPQEISYRTESISHPFRNLEPVAIHFAYKNGVLSCQFIHWDHFGKSQQKIRNKTFSIGALNKWGTMDFSIYSYGSVAYQAGAIMNPGAPTGNQLGLAEVYMEELKDKSNDLKQYIWGKDTYWNYNPRQYWNLKKTQSTSSLEFIDAFLKNSVANGSFQPYWNPERDNPFYGDLFYTFSMAVLNEDNFNTSNDLIDVSEASEGSYCWVMMGEIDFYNIGIFKKKTGNETTLLNPDYYNYGVLPWGFKNSNSTKQMLKESRTNKNMNEIIYTLSLDEPTYINNLSLNIILADELELELIDEQGISISYSTKTNYYLVSQDQIKTKINFF